MSSNGAVGEAERGQLHVKEDYQPSPETLNKLVKRLRVLTLTLLPVEVDPAGLEDATSRAITPEVIAAYIDAAGDFVDALPYCLLHARKDFMWDANHSPADYEENYGRAIACEVLARRVAHRAKPDRLTYVLSNRFQSLDWDGDESDLVSAVELAADTHCTIFLSSNEAQDVINHLWSGDLVTRRKGWSHQDYISYQEIEKEAFFGRLDPSRMSVPRYQNMFRISVWLAFLVIYSQAVREPLDKVNPNHTRLDVFEVLLYAFALSFAVQDISKLWKLLLMVTFRSFTFWLIVSLITDALFVTAFGLRIYGLWVHPGEDGWHRLRAFQVLSYIAPLIWAKLITIFDGYKYVGTMQICIARMLRESGIFFALLSIMGIGFAQGLWALDAADEEAASPTKIVNLLIQALLQAPAYDQFTESTAGLVLYYFWNVITAIILLNVLISLFSSAYDDVVEDAAAEYLAFFASKTIEMIRAPDEYVYPAPLNILETFLIAPLELCMSKRIYAKMNRYVMVVVFFMPLSMIAFYESVFRSRQNHWLKDWFAMRGEGEEDSPENRDPSVSDTEAEGRTISKVKFDDLVARFPNTQLSSEAALSKELRDLKAQLAEVLRRLEGGNSHDQQATLPAPPPKKRSKKKKSGTSSSSSSSSSSN